MWTWETLSRYYPSLVLRLGRLVEYVKGTELRGIISELLIWLIRVIALLEESADNFEQKLLDLQDEKFRIEEYEVDTVTEVQLELVAYLQTQVLKDIRTTEQLARGDIGPSRDAALLIRSMLTGEEYKYDDSYKNEKDRLLHSIRSFYEKGYTIDDFFRGVYPEILQQYRNLKKNADENLEAVVKEEFRALETKDITDLLSYIAQFAKQGMSLDEFYNGFGHVWNRLNPETAQWVKKTYARYRGNSDVENEIHHILETQMQTFQTRLFSEIPKLVANGIDFTGLLYGMNATALEWFDAIRHIPGMQAKVKQAFETARQNLIQEFLNMVQIISITMPHLSYNDFLGSQAHELFQFDDEIERFNLLFQTIAQYPDYSSIEKQMKSFFRGRSA